MQRQGLGYHEQDDGDSYQQSSSSSPVYYQEQQYQQEQGQQQSEEEEYMFDKEYVDDLFDESKNVEFAHTEVTSSVPPPNLRNKAKQKALQMMKNMGWNAGSGLGAQNKGITTHIELTQKSDRGGLGMKSTPGSTEPNRGTKKPLPSNFKIQKHAADNRTYPYRENVNWISCRNPIVDMASLYKIYLRNELNETEPRFCDKELLQRVMNMKSEFDNVDSEIFSRARERSNPYELIDKSIFQNRAAVKMANLDKIADLTNSLELLPEEKGILYFADICAGPGGFTEYLYWKFKTERAKGWGFTLRGKNDFKLESFNEDAPHDNFTTCYGVDDTGDITRNENMKQLSDEIDKGTEGRGVALLLADGGFSVQEDYNQQEILTRQIVFCQFITSLLVLRKGGTFVCKVFDVYTNFSASLLYMLYQNFENFSIIKPFTSRPANSERYVVCKGLRTRKPLILDFLFDVNTRLTQKVDIAAIIHPDIISHDIAFVDYFTKSNNSIMREQLYALSNIKKYIEDEYLDIKDKQLQLKEQCLKEWGLPSIRNSSSTRGRRRQGGRGNRYQQKPRESFCFQQSYHPSENPVSSTWESDHHASVPAYNPSYPDRLAPINAYSPAQFHHHYEPYNSHSYSHNQNSYYASEDNYAHDHGYRPSSYQSSSSWEEGDNDNNSWEENPRKKQRRE